MGKPAKGAEIGRGAEGSVYEIPSDPTNVLKEFRPGATSPLQAWNEFQNLQKARTALPDNVVAANAPADPKQGWIVKEKVFRTVPTASQLAERTRVAQQLINAGVHDVQGNLMFGHTASNSAPRWILIE